VEDWPIYQNTVTVMNFMAQLEGAWDGLNVAWIQLHYWQDPPTRGLMP
jgi:hypothetical protein